MSCKYYGCSGLTSIIVDSNNTTYDSRNNCNAIIETATKTLIWGCQNTTIPNSVTSISSSAFSGCSGLTSVTIPNSVTSIGDWAFSDCTGLTFISIGNSVTLIGSSAFSGCSGLTSVTINSNAIVSKSYSSRSSLSGIFGEQVKEYVLGEGVNSIGQYAFYGAKEVSSISIPNSVTLIESYAFSCCTSLTAINIPEGVTSIGYYAFSGCENLKSCAVPDGVKKLSDNLFYGCKRMTEVRIGKDVEKIGNEVFNGCSLIRIYNYAEFPQDCGSNVFTIVKQNCKLYVPKDSPDLYRVHKEWYQFNIQPMDDEALPVEPIVNGEKTTSILYDLSGRLQTKSAKGINIIRFSDGSTKKVLNK